MRIFISHSTKDETLVRDIEEIARKYGMNSFVAERHLEYGEELNKRLMGEIDRSDTIIYLCTEESNKSVYVGNEIGYAMKAGKDILPIVVGDAELKGLAKGMFYLKIDDLTPESYIPKISEAVIRLKIEASKKNLVIGLLVAIVSFVALYYFYSQSKKPEGTEKSVMNTNNKPKNGTS